MEQTIDNLASAHGRALLQQYWYENLVEARRWKIGVALSCWRLCVAGRVLYLADAERPVAIEHTLGVRMGTRVWMEEISYKHFNNTVQALVYLGAVVLLIFVGLRFADLINERLALIGIGIEATMLFVLFVVMFYTPEESDTIAAENQQDSGGVKEYLPLFKEIYDELQDIGTMNAALGRHLTDMANKQESYLKELSQKLSFPSTNGISREGAELLANLRATIAGLSDSIKEMNANVRHITQKELEYLVRKEFERVVGAGMQSSDTTPEAGNSGTHEASSHKIG